MSDQSMPHGGGGAGNSPGQSSTAHYQAGTAPKSESSTSQSPLGHSIELRRMEHEEKRKDRRNNLMIALVTAVVTIAVALGTSAYTSRQAHEDARNSQRAQDERADEDFRREQQRDAYNAFYGAAADLHAAHSAVYNAIRCACMDLPNADYTNYNAAWKTFGEAKAKFLLSYAVLYMVASHDTQKSADAILRFFDNLASTDMVDADEEMIRDAGGDGTERDQYYEKIQDANGLLKNFMRSAKNDIAIYGS